MIDNEQPDLNVPGGAFESREQMQSYVESVLSLEVLDKYELSQILGLEINVELVDAGVFADGVL